MAEISDKIFGSRIRAKILGWLFTHPEESFFVRQIAAILGEDPTNVSREMARLEELGVLRSKRQGNLKNFRTDPRCPFFEELKGLVSKTSGVVPRIRAALEELSELDLAFIHGSYAGGEEKTGSAVDLLVIGSLDSDRLDSNLRPLERSLGRKINRVVYTMEEFNSKKKAKDRVLMEVLNGKVIVI